MKKRYLLILVVFISFTAAAQNVGIGTTIPSASAVLEIKSSNKGLLIPRTSTTSRTAIVNPAKGSMLYDTTTSSFWFHNGSAWVQIQANANGWSLTGNAGTNEAANFIGTADAHSLAIKVNNQKSGYLDYASPYKTNFGYQQQVIEQQKIDIDTLKVQVAALTKTVNALINK